MGSYLVNVNLAGHIGIFYAMQGIVSLFMPAIMGIIADRWVPAQKLLSFSHFMAAIFMGLAGYYGMTSGQDVEFGPLFGLYALSVAFYMPTLALSNSVAYTALDKAGLDTIKHFPPIRIFGTIGFICAMWLVVLRPDPTRLPHEQGRTKQIAGRSAGPARLHPVQAKENGHLLHLLHAAGRVAANHQRICQPLHQQLRQHT